jgi:Ribosomal protein L4/L1 family
MATTKKTQTGAKKRAKAKQPVTKSVEVPAVFQCEPKLSVLHQAVVRHLANRRAGTADTKTRDEVAGGGRKPWRQKGTGRARHGSIRSPIWRTGGVVFGPHPRSFAIGMNKKARRQALAMAVAVKLQAGGLSIIDTAALGSGKTKDIMERQRTRLGRRGARRRARRQCPQHPFGRAQPAPGARARPQRALGARAPERRPGVVHASRARRPGGGVQCLSHAS